MDQILSMITGVDEALSVEDLGFTSSRSALVMGFQGRS